MLVANSFDLWQKDSFFSAAEEVQQSADIMESAYRTWLRARKEGSQHLDELCRELQMALGTAKWQLEEFERAVRLSYGKHVDDVTITRHRQFVSALEEQISHVEAAVKESFNVERKKPFRWVNIAEEECDDFAQFLSGTPGAHSVKDDSISLESGASSTFSNKYYMKEDCSPGSEISSKTQISSCGKNLEVALSNGTAKCYMDLEERKRSEMGDELMSQAEKNTNHLRTWSSPDGSALEIVIDCDDRQKNALIEATPKEKGSKPSFWRSRREGRPGTEGRMLSHFHSKITDWISQSLRGGHRSQRQQQISPVLPVNSLRFILALMLTIFLVGMHFLWSLLFLLNMSKMFIG